MTFAQERDDLRRVLQWVKNPPYRYWLGVFVFVVLAAVYGWFNSRDPLLGACVVGINILFSFPLFALRERRAASRTVDKMLADEPTRIGLRTLSLSRDGICWSGEAKEVLFPWSDFRGVRRHPHFLFLLMNDGKFIPVPLRAFTHRAEVDLFRKMLTAYKMAEGNEALMPSVADEQVWPPPPRTLKS